MDDDFFCHYPSNDDKFTDRLSAAGYIYSNAGENIEMGYTSEESVISGGLPVKVTVLI